MAKAEAEAAGPSAARRLWAALLAAMPPSAEILVGAPLWAMAMGCSALFGLLMRDWQMTGHVRNVALLFGLAALFALPLGLWLARLLLTLHGGRASRFAAGFVALTLATVGLTAIVYAFDYRQYYAEWHDNAFSIRWVLELVFTGLAAFYQFAVMGLPLFFPIGFIALLVASLWFARWAH